MLWANGHITIDIVESAQRLGTRFKFIGQQKKWAFSYDMWGKKVGEYVEAVDMPRARLRSLNMHER